ncbi:MAG: hypothetical protein IPP22_02985 [Nitrosomonas sp.]|nr:hypothetical protein [Nitrosomonas sp.]
MTRVAAKVTCSDQDRKEWTGSSRTDQARLVERARLLGCLAANERRAAHR